MFRESTIVTNEDGNIISYSLGEPDRVVFDFLTVWKYVDKHHVVPTYMNFYHVHPRMFPYHSDLDLNCMRGFVKGFGSDIYFSIILFVFDDPLDTTFTQLSYICKRDGVQECKHRFPSDDQLLFLKYLSYGGNQE
jgi:hypothetical protein